MPAPTRTESLPPRPLRTVTNLLWFAGSVLLVLLYAVTVYPHGEAAFESRFDKFTAQAQEMKQGALRDEIFFDETFFDEIFFLFIASGIGVGITLLAIWWTRRRRNSRSTEGWTLTERYRSHLIFVKAYQQPDTDRWRASVHVQFNRATFRDVRLPGPTSHFSTKTTAEQQALKEAKLWVDERLRKAKMRAS